MGNGNTDCDGMPERIWLSPEGAHLPYQPTMHWEWQEYRRADLCASGQVRALEARPWVVFDAVFRFLKDDAKTQEVFDAITSALTPAPQPEGQVMDGWVDDKMFIEPVSPAATPTAQEAAPVVDGSLQARIGEVGNQIYNIACEHQDNEPLAERLGELRSELWTLAKLAAHPPQPSEEVAEALKLAAARLQRLALEIPSTTPLRAEAFKWADEALRALKGESE